MTEFIDIPSPGWPLEFGAAGRPVVVLVHDEYGRLPYLEAYGAALAKQGFHVLVPDLFDGVATVQRDGAAELVARLDEGFAVALIEDAIALGRAAPEPTAADELALESALRESSAPDAAAGPGPARAAVIGLGLGGRLALRLAQSGAADAVVAYYAELGDDHPGILPCPVLAHRPADPAWDHAVAFDLFVSRLKEQGTPITVHRYEGAREGFANATMLELLDKNAAALAFARSTYFLQAQLLD